MCYNYDVVVHFGPCWRPMMIPLGIMSLGLPTRCRQDKLITSKSVDIMARMSMAICILNREVSYGIFDKKRFAQNQ